MKVAIIGPGVMSIPPKGWGAVETIIHEYQTRLEKAGWNVLIINTKDHKEIVSQVNAFEPDFVHCQYDELIVLMNKIHCPHKAITSHYGYINNVWDHDKYLSKVHIPICQSKDVLIFALSEDIAETYRADGVSASRIFVVPNGVSRERFVYSPQPLFPNRSLYLGKIDYRKRQGVIQKYGASVDFAGNLCHKTALSSGFDPNQDNYLGEWSREDVYEHMTDYANLVLLSDGEAHALVCMEALSAGLGLVVSEYATANLDLTKRFICVLPEDRFQDRDYVRDRIAENREISISCRDEIRAYSKEFSWDRVVSQYIDFVSKLVEARSSPDSSSSLSNPRVAIVTIATGAYFNKFFRDFAESVRNVFLSDVQSTIFCFTDALEVDVDGVKLIPARFMGWPFDTLFRFHLISSIMDQLMKFDMIIYMDSDMRAVDKIETPLFGKPLFAVRHPGFAKYPKRATFEIASDEATYVPPSLRKNYAQGCFFGGGKFEFKKLVHCIRARIDADLIESHIPVWHDESYLNWYLASVPHEVVSSAYAYPEGWRLPIKPIVLHLAKEHSTVRRISSSAIEASDIMLGLSAEKSSEIYRKLYLRAHTKCQLLEIAMLRNGSALRASNNYLGPDGRVRPGSKARLGRLWALLSKWISFGRKW